MAIAVPNFTGLTPMQAVVKDVCANFIGREIMATLIALASIMKGHVLIHGPKGCAKSDVSMEMFKRITNAKHFYLQGHEELPVTEMVGPIMLSKLIGQDIEEHKIDGYLWDADYAHLDEVGRFGGTTLNAQLNALNERIAKNGNQVLDLPLWTAVGTTNTRLTGVHEANADRYILHHFVSYLQSEADLADLDDLDIQRPYRRVNATIDHDEIKRLHSQLPLVKAQTPIEVWEAKREIVKLLRKEGIVISDRRYKAANSVIAAMAMYEGRGAASTDDLTVLEYVFMDSPDQLLPIRKAITEIANPLKLVLVSKYDDAVSMHDEVMKAVADAKTEDQKNKAQGAAMKAMRDMGEIIGELEETARKYPGNADIAAAIDKIEKLQNDVQRRGYKWQKRK